MSSAVVLVAIIVGLLTTTIDTREGKPHLSRTTAATPARPELGVLLCYCVIVLLCYCFRPGNRGNATH